MCENKSTAFRNIEYAVLFVSKFNTVRCINAIIVISI